MTLPFKKDEASIVAPIDSMKRKPDKPEAEMEIIDLIAEHMLAAIKKGDRAALADGLQAFMFHMRSMDEEQDEAMEESQGEEV
jgi:hypothetical protein